MHQILFRLVLRPRPHLQELTALPVLVVFEEAYFYGEGEEEGKGGERRKGKGREGRRGENVEFHQLLLSNLTNMCDSGWH